MDKEWLDSSLGNEIGCMRHRSIVHLGLPCSSRSRPLTTHTQLLWHSARTHALIQCANDAKMDALRPARLFQRAFTVMATGRTKGAHGTLKSEEMVRADSNPRKFLSALAAVSVLCRRSASQCLSLRPPCVGCSPVFGVAAPCKVQKRLWVIRHVSHTRSSLCGLHEQSCRQSMKFSSVVLQVVTSYLLCAPVREKHPCCRCLPQHSLRVGPTPPKAINA